MLEPLDQTHSAYEMHHITETLEYKHPPDIEKGKDEPRSNNRELKIVVAALCGLLILLILGLVIKYSI